VTSGERPLRLVSPNDLGEHLAAVAATFDPARLLQARRIAGLTKSAVADAVAVSPAAVGQWEIGTAVPRPDRLERLANLLDVPAIFFTSGRPYARLDAADAHFRRLRSTPAQQRDRAVAFTEQVWELTHALEQRVALPAVDLPAGLPTADRDDGAGLRAPQPEEAAQHLRRHWNLGDGPVAQVVRTLERHGVVVSLVPFAGTTTATVDAFSTSRLPRPIIVLTPDRALDVYRHRFTAAHELGHLLLHGESPAGDPVLEKEADQFAAEFLTPRGRIVPELPARLDLHRLDVLSTRWGVSVESLLYRCRELGSVSDPTYRRAYQRLNQARQLGLFRPEPVDAHPGEVPVMLRQAADIASDHGLSHADLADQLHLRVPRLQLLLGQHDSRPALTLT
jgi:Zn-dependent peptidase ImmA (M78 family)/transcriptional regulator with XRE-family HTH domain